jgi:Spy/CpxP family protein refolding chaperone
MGIASTVLFGAGTTIGCGASSANTPPPATAASAAPVDDEAMAGVKEYHRYHHHGGVMLFIVISLDTLGVSPEERARVEKIRGDLHARLDPARTAEQTLEATLADGVAAGNIDAAKVDAAVAQLTTAAAAAEGASVDAMNELHNVLTPPERAALADKVESHWAVWQNANVEETEPGSPNERRLARLAENVDLTPDQVDKIRAALAEGMKAVPRLDRQEISTHLRAFGDAFRTEKFDASAFTIASGANAHLVVWGATHRAHFVETVSPLLTPDQRTLLAQRLHEHATHDPSAQGAP